MSAPPLADRDRSARWAALYPYLLLALCQLAWAGNWVMGRWVRDAMPPLALAFWRWTIAALALAPFAVPRLRGKGALLRRHWRVLGLLGITGAGYFQAMIYIGLRYTEAVNATMMNSASPLFIVLIAWLAGIERVTPRQLLGMFVSFCGIMIILNRGDLTELRHFHFNPGDLIVLAAMPIWGVYCVALRRRPAGLDGIALLFILCCIGALALMPFYALESVYVGPVHPSAAGFGAVLYVGLVASVLGYILWNRGVELVGANRAGFTNHLLPAMAVVLAMLLLGEQVHPFHLVGIATIIAGVWLATSQR